MTVAVFQRQMERLRVLRFVSADFNAHWEVLRDIPDEVFTAAVGHALRTRVEFPMPAELRADCDAAVRRHAPQAVHPTSRLVPIEGTKPIEIKNPFGGPSIIVQLAEEPYHDCDECDDTGTVLYWCGSDLSKRWPWMYVRRCARTHEHGEHDWSAACPCVPTNPTIARRNAAKAAKYSQEPEKVGR